MPISNKLFLYLKEIGILKTRLVRAGLAVKGRIMSIPVIGTRRMLKSTGDNAKPYSSVNRSNLIAVNTFYVNETNRGTITADKFAVPKCMFLNICSLVKTGNGIKASVALEADLFSNDIDVCVISETHLKKDVPDSVVGVSNYSIYRRDRNWFGNDNREKGGVAIYIRSNINIKQVLRSEIYEMISLQVELPSGHLMLICGIYHPQNQGIRKMT